jgi:hypothetical protein
MKIQYFQYITIALSLSLVLGSLSARAEVAAPPPPTAPAPKDPMFVKPPPGTPPASGTVPEYIVVLNDESLLPLPKATSSASSRLKVKAGFEVFGQYLASWTRQDSGKRKFYHEFSASRIHLAMSGMYRNAFGRVLVEGARASDGGSVLGVSGDSMVARFREAYAGYQIPDWADFRIGIVPSLTIPAIESTWGLRLLAPTSMERFQLSSPADAGANGRLLFPRNYGYIGIGTYNGEGYTQREVNRGKNTEVLTEVFPLASVPALSPLAVMLGYIQGSAGPESSRANRFTGGLLWHGQRIQAGGVTTYGWGVEGQGGQKALLVEGFVRAEVVKDVLIGVRATHFQRNTAVTTDRLRLLLLGVGYRLAEPLLAFLAVRRTIPGAQAELAVPGQDRWEILGVSRIAF